MSSNINYCCNYTSYWDISVCNFTSTNLTILNMLIECYWSSTILQLTYEKCMITAPVYQCLLCTFILNFTCLAQLAHWLLLLNWKLNTAVSLQLPCCTMTQSCVLFKDISPSRVLWACVKRSHCGNSLQGCHFIMKVGNKNCPYWLLISSGKISHKVS
jgi:hypothetical protein